MCVVCLLLCVCVCNIIIIIIYSLAIAPFNIKMIKSALHYNICIHVCLYFRYVVSAD